MDHELQWESLQMGSQNSIKTNESHSPEAIDNENELLVSVEPASLANLAPLSSISEVTLDKFPTS